MEICVHDLVFDWCAICTGTDTEPEDKPLTFEGLIKGPKIEGIRTGSFSARPSSHFHVEGDDSQDL